MIASLPKAAHADDMWGKKFQLFYEAESELTKLLAAVNCVVLLFLMEYSYFPKANDDENNKKKEYGETRPWKCNIISFPLFTLSVTFSRKKCKNKNFVFHSELSYNNFCVGVEWLTTYVIHTYKLAARLSRSLHMLMMNVLAAHYATLWHCHRISYNVCVSHVNYIYDSFSLPLLAIWIILLCTPET